MSVPQWYHNMVSCGIFIKIRSNIKSTLNSTKAQSAKLQFCYSDTIGTGSLSHTHTNNKLLYQKDMYIN